MGLGLSLFVEAPLGRSDWEYLFGLASSSAIVWTQAGFLLIRILFLAADDLHLLAFHLPLGARERQAGFVLLEALMVLVGCAAGLAVFGISAIVVLGPPGLVLIATYLLIPVLVTYSVLQAGATVVALACAALPVGRLRRIVLVALLVALLAGSVEVSSRFLVGASEGGPVSPYAGLVEWLRETARPWPLALGTGALVVVAIAVAVALVAAPREHVPAAAYSRVRIGRLGRGLLGAYMLQHARSQQTMLAIVISVAAFAALTVRPIVHPGLALTLLSLPGLYQYAASRRLHRLQGHRRPAWWQYLALALPQMALLALGTIIAVLVLLATRPASVGEVGGHVGASVVGIVLVTAIGVAFPADDANPFSVLIGGTVCSFALAGMALLLGVLNATPLVLMSCVVALTVVLVGLTVLGIHVIEKVEAPTCAP
ncbi:hypothetical protein [Agrococcus versicolor]|uniref:hypothetical protein n=1 Tax=Agrococcus versicolor TaxID=501482 RepID=UPI0031E45A99